ncbi:hypothetical protein HanIR_Chr17g0896581 [Helianthus annuus]|nr:hypothetical protein HanIR_Chr17g0896581 [Helianthus annuus]
MTDQETEGSTIQPADRLRSISHKSRRVAVDRVQTSRPGTMSKDGQEERRTSQIGTITSMIALMRF